MTTVFDRADVVCVPNQALGEEESGRESAIVARRPHDNGERPALQPDFERLLDNSRIQLGSRAADPYDGDIPYHGRRRYGAGLVHRYTGRFVPLVTLSVVANVRYISQAPVVRRDMPSARSPNAFSVSAWEFAP